MKKYQPNLIEPKWQKKWREKTLYLTNLSVTKNKFYMLAELPYTSGDLHMGHWFTFSASDAIARFKRMRGYNVIFPNGFDAFGLPAENAAIKNNIHPQDWTYNNARIMKDQFDTMGSSIDWTKTMISCDPEYYKWNQWIFIKMFNQGIAYKGKAISNWCPNCQTVLADENIEAGKCWRCGTEVIKRQVDQWFLKITAYADELLWSKPPQADWPKSLREAQNSWIGRSEGTSIKFEDLEVFTTRPDTVFGATFIVLSPEYPNISKYITKQQNEIVKDYITKASKKKEQERKEEKEKSGVFSGSYVENPFTKEKIPVWIADYVLMGYGTGVIMAVPAHDDRDFEFAKKFDLPIKQVIKDKNQQSNNLGKPFVGEGVLINSGEFTGLNSEIARSKIIEYIEKHQIGSRQVQYHLRDWSISRQRYWGTPIPIIYCKDCDMVTVPEEELPVELPYKVDYTPKGKPPLATAQDWVNVNCPKCGKKAKRETETLDGFMDNSWYFYRYLDPNNSKQIFDSKIINAWMPIDIYIGGAEHTFGHALYSRFFTKFFHKLGIVNFSEYAHKRVHHGVILGPDGNRMSKSRGNVVNPDEEVKKYGADAIRVYLMFIGPYQDIVAPWKAENVFGVYHFLQRVWALYDKIEKQKKEINAEAKLIMNKAIHKITQDLDDLKFNTSIAGLMEWLNFLSREEAISREEYKTFLKLLAPFAPHITEELWYQMGEQESIHLQKWPSVDIKALDEEEVKIVIQVNGRVRETLLIQNDILTDSKKVENLALNSLKVQKFLVGNSPKRTIYIPGKIINFVT